MTSYRRAEPARDIDDAVALLSGLRARLGSSPVVMGSLDGAIACLLVARQNLAAAAVAADDLLLVADSSRRC